MLTGASLAGLTGEQLIGSHNKQLNLGRFSVSWNEIVGLFFAIATVALLVNFFGSSKSYVVPDNTGSAETNAPSNPSERGDQSSRGEGENSTSGVQEPRSDENDKGSQLDNPPTSSEDSQPANLSSSNDILSDVKDDPEVIVSVLLSGFCITACWLSVKRGAMKQDITLGRHLRRPSVNKGLLESSDSSIAE